MKLSIIIPCLNEEEYLGSQLEALANQAWSEPWEVIVADNGSTDQSRVIVEKFKGRLPNLQFVDASDRRGQAHAKNVGARAATGNALVFCDADDEVAPGWVSAIGKALARHDVVASRFDIEKLNPPWVRAGRGAPQRDGVLRYSYPPFLPHAGGCGLGVKRVLHEAVNGFDEALPVLEDTDYCFRLQLAGAKLHFVPEAVVYIRFPLKQRDRWRQARLWGKYNVLLYKKYRHLSMPSCQWKDGVSAWVRLMRYSRQIRNKTTRAAWLWQFAWRLGRLQGCIKYRVLAL